MGKLNVADWVDCTEVEGPGKRFAIWVQGCLFRCPGCCNPHMLDITPKKLVETNEVITWIARAKKKYDIEGVTFLGGEPMLQAKGLAEIAIECRKINLSVIVFSGYTLEYLKKEKISGAAELLSLVDVLVDGVFIIDKMETKRNWVGSTNQRFRYLTDRYNSEIESAIEYSPSLELRLSKDGTLITNGWPYSIEF